MTALDDAQPAPPPAELPAEHVRSRSFLGACVATLIWTIVLLVFIVDKASVAPTVVATVVSIVSTVTAIIGIFQTIFEPPKFRKINPKITKAVVAAVLIVDFGVSVGWVGWSSYRANRTIDVLSGVTLAQNIGVLPDRLYHATLDVTTTETRDTIVLVFQIDDHNPHLGICRPYTSLEVTRDKAGNPGETVSMIHGTPMSVDLPAGSRKLHLDIAVTNTHGDRNCLVDLRVTSATLQNK